MGEDDRWRAAFDGLRAELHNVEREVASLKQVVLGPESMNGLKQEVRQNADAIRSIREDDIRAIREQEIAPLRSARDEAEAVRETRRSMMRIGAGMILAQVAIITLLLRIAEVV